MTCDVIAKVLRPKQWEWKYVYEVFSICRDCNQPTMFLISSKNLALANIFEARDDDVVTYKGSLNKYFTIERFISLRDQALCRPSEHLPENILNAFREAAACLVVGCHNASAAMFRLCVNLATKDCVSKSAQGGNPTPKAQEVNFLKPRLDWLFNEGLIPLNLHDLSTCIREDGNVGAHDGTLTKEDAENMLEFTESLLEAIYTQPKKLELKKERRTTRRAKPPACN
jgi:hypothetical protein